MYITAVPNRGSPPAILLRESYREDGKVKNRTLANLSMLPPHAVEALREALKNGPATGGLPEGFDVLRSLPHGNVVAALGTLRKLGLHRTLAKARSRQRDLCEALIASRIIEKKPRSKLSTARHLRAATAKSTLGDVLELTGADEDELYAAMDWLLAQQSRIERSLAKRHLREGSLVLYDLTSTYFEGRKCSLAKLGHSRDGKSGTLQIVFGLLTDGEGCPVAVEVFDGNTADPMTVAAQVEKLRTRFELKRIVLVGDRGMLTSARIRENVATAEGVAWISALRNPAIVNLVETGTLQLSLFDQQDLAEITAPEFPGERLIVCKNPLLAKERARKRLDLLAATEKALAEVQAATRRTKRPLRGEAAIGMRVGRVLNRFKVGKHFETHIALDGFTFARRQERIDAEAALDGIYVIRTSLSAGELKAEDVVRNYKRLAAVERAFRSIKTVDLEVRPVNHHLADRVRAHVFLCMLAYYVEWHMRRVLAPLLFHDENREAAEAQRSSIVAPAPRSETAREKDRSKRNASGLPVQSFRDLLEDLGTVAKVWIQPAPSTIPAFTKVTNPTAIQKRAFDLLGLSPLQM